MRRVFCHPVVVDMALVVYRLDGETLTLERYPHAAFLVGSNFTEIQESLKDFEHVSPKEFYEICTKQASTNSILAFEARYKELYGE